MQSTSDPRRSRETLASGKVLEGDPRTDPYLGWGEVPGIDIEVIEVPGVHRSILREEEHTRTLAEKLSVRLRLAQNARSVSA